MATERRYTERFRRLFRQHRTTYGNSIDAFARSVNPRAVGMVDSDDFLAPVRFTVQLGASLSDPAAAVRIEQHVSPHTDSSDWVAELKGSALRMAGMEPAAATLARTELRTMTGRPISASTVRRPEAVGRLRLFVGGKQVKIAAGALPAPPPELSTTKRRDIEQALVKALRTLPDVLARELDTKDVVGVNRALQPGAAVETAIGAHLSNAVAGSAGVSWSEFVRRHHTQPRRAAADARLAQDALDRSKRAILSNVRSMLRRAEDSVTRYIASQEAQTIGAAALVLGSKRIDPVTANVASGRQLYARLIDDALSPDAAPALLQRLVDTVHEYRPDAGAIMAARPTALRAELAHRVDRAHHPFHAMVHGTLMPVRGAYPAAYMARLMARQDMSAEAPYRGDADRTHVAFHLLAGLGSVPPPLIVRNGVPQPIAHYLPQRRPPHTKGEEEKSTRAMGARAPMATESGMPALVAPPTIPVGAYANEEEEEAVPTAPVRFPYTGDADALAAIKAEMRSRLVPVNTDAANAVDDEMLPPIDDVYT